MFELDSRLDHYKSFKIGEKVIPSKQLLNEYKSWYNGKDKAMEFINFGYGIISKREMYQGTDSKGIPKYHVYEVTYPNGGKETFWANFFEHCINVLELE